MNLRSEWHDNQPMSSQRKLRDELGNSNLEKFDYFGDDIRMCVCVCVGESVPQWKIHLELIMASKLLDVRLQLWQRSAALVLGLSLSILVEEECGIALNLLINADLLILRRCAIHFGHHDARLAYIRRQLLPGGLQLLAVSAPGGVKLNEGNAIGGSLFELIVAVQLQYNLLFSLLLCLLGIVVHVIAGAGCTNHLHHIRLEGGQVACARILLDLLAILDPQQCGVALHLKVLANAAILCAVDFRNSHASLLDQLLGQLLPGGCQTLDRMQTFEIS